MKVHRVSQRAVDRSENNAEKTCSPEIARPVLLDRTRVGLADRPAQRVSWQIERPSEEFKQSAIEHRVKYPLQMLLSRVPESLLLLFPDTFATSRT